MRWLDSSFRIDFDIGQGVDYQEAQGPEVAQCVPSADVKILVPTKRVFPLEADANGFGTLYSCRWLLH